MAWRSAGTLTRSLSRVSSIRSPPPIPRLHPPQVVPRPQSRRFSFVAPRNMGELGCMASFLPLQSTVAAARIMSVNPRAFSELSHVTWKGLLDQHNEVQEKIRGTRRVLWEATGSCVKVVNRNH